MMKHDDSLAKAIRSNLERGVVGGEWIGSTRPRLYLRRSWVIRMMLAVVKYDTKHPVSDGNLVSSDDGAEVHSPIGSLVLVMDALQIEIGRAVQIRPVQLMRIAHWHILRGLSF